MVEARDGFMQAFALARNERPRAIELPPAAPFGITDCYIKPYACCRHIQPAVEATIGLMADEKIAVGDVERVEVETYRIAAEHAHTGWDDYASAQLSFPYLMAVALQTRRRFSSSIFPTARGAIRRSPGSPGNSTSRLRRRSTSSTRACARRA